jgi:hypothetical protein
MDALFVLGVGGWRRFYSKPIGGKTPDGVTAAPRLAKNRRNGDIYVKKAQQSAEIRREAFQVDTSQV